MTPALLSVALGILAGLCFVDPATAQYCRCECYRVPGGRVCRRVCSYPQPRYVAPAPREPPYVAPHQSYSPPPVPAQPAFPAELIGALLILLGAGPLIAFLAQGISTASLRAATAAVEHDTFATRALHDQADATAHEIDAFVDHSARQHFDRGRAAADEEWTRD